MDKILIKRVDANTIGFKMLGGIKISFEESEKIITELSEQGYSYKGYVPIEQLGDGRFTKIDLIFEKKESN